jgi:hypothetical protein
MDGDYNVFECLGQNPPKREEAREPVVAPLPSEDVDLFAQFGMQAPEQQVPTPEAKPRKRPATTRFQKEFEELWRPIETFWKQQEAKRKAQSSPTLMWDEPLYPESDPYEWDLHSTPHR